MCELLSSGTFEERPEHVRSCVYINRKDIFTNVLSDVCKDNCSDHQLCDRELRQCTVKECQPFSVENAEIFANMMKFGSRCLIKCQPGYVPVGGNIHTTCSLTGKWEPTLLCKRLCPPAVAPSNGQVSAPNSYEGEIATYTCISGYSLVGSGTATCESGVWTPIAPLCQQVCPPAVAPSNGQVSAPNSYEGEIATYTCISGYSLVGSGTATCESGVWTPIAPLCQQVDCYDILRDGGTSSGVYTVYLQGNTELKVYCDMTTNGGGWTVFQYRYDGSVDFFATFAEYENGFGDVHGEFWMGLKQMYAMTDRKKSEIYLNFVDSDGNIAMERFSDFYISSGANYKLHVGELLQQNDTTPNYSLLANNGENFSAKDLDQDRYDVGNCAERHRGGWWYNACSKIHPNGDYATPGQISAYLKGGAGMINRGWKGTESLKSTKLMFRRMNQ